jgi:hypothetical protein
MHAVAVLSDQDQTDLLNVLVLLKRIGSVPSCRMATVANIAASKINDVLQIAKDEQPEEAPF